MELLDVIWRLAQQESQRPYICAMLLGMIIGGAVMLRALRWWRRNGNGRN